MGEAIGEVLEVALPLLLLLAAFVFLAVLIWRVCRWAAGLVWHARRDASARSALALGAALSFGAHWRADLLWGPDFTPFLLLDLGILLAFAVFYGLFHSRTRDWRVMAYVIMVVGGLFVIPLHAPMSPHIADRRASRRLYALHELGKAVTQYRTDMGGYRPSVVTLVTHGYAEQKTLVWPEDGTWTVYWPPTKDARAGETVAFNWPPVGSKPDTMRTEILFGDGGVATVFLSQGEPLVNPGTGEVIMPAPAAVRQGRSRLSAIRSTGRTDGKEA